MIKKLRRRFICINMLIVTIMLFVILGLMVNMTKNSLEADSLDVLAAAYIPDKKDHHTEGSKEEKTPKPTGSSVAPSESTQPGESQSPTVTEPSKESSSQPQSAGQKPGKDDKPEKDKKNSKMPTFTLSYGENGTLIAEGSDFYDLTDTAYLESLMTAAKERNAEYGVLWSQSMRFYRGNSKGTVYSFMDISSEQSTLLNLVLDSLVIGAIAFGGFLILSIFLARLVIKPVEKAWTQQQQFIADASHELKTPLTVIITSAELMEGDGVTEDTRQTCVGNILETSRRMRSLTEEMLNLARAENAQEELLQDPCDLSEILEDSVLIFEPLFFEKGLELESQIEAGITLKGNETQLRQLGELLLDNGQKYSLPGKTVLTLKKLGFRSCELTLSNPANPISEEELNKLFERFYRVDPARTASGSYGLGLAIARGIVQRHGGSINAEYKDGRITFRAKLPLS